MNICQLFLCEKGARALTTIKWAIHMIAKIVENGKTGKRSLIYVFSLIATLQQNRKTGHLENMRKWTITILLEALLYIHAPGESPKNVASFGPKPNHVNTSAES